MANDNFAKDFMMDSLLADEGWLDVQLIIRHVPKT